MPPHLPLLLFVILLTPTSALDFLFNSFNATTPGLLLIPDARVDSSVVRLTNDTNQYTLGRAFYPSKLNLSSSSSFSTSFVFSILPEISTDPGLGIVFVLSNSTNPPNALHGQYFGVFSNLTNSVPAPLFAVEFDIGLNPEFNDPDPNHIGVDLNNAESAKTAPAGYYNSSSGRRFVPVDMRSGANLRAWIEFDAGVFQINVTLAPAGVAKPPVPSLSYKDPVIADYLSPEMYVGFSSAKLTWNEAQRILAWSFSDTGNLKEINTTNLPVFSWPDSSSASLSTGGILGISLGCVALVLLILIGLFYFLARRRMRQREEEEEEDIEEWELEFWPHRFSYEELSLATNGFSDENLLGSGGFGKVYKGQIANPISEVAVKCVNHDSKQGLREFMAEISSLGRLQHKNLVQMRGWCKKSTQLLLVYDFMPNGSLDRYIYGKDKTLSWPERGRILGDVAEGLHYLHHGWEQVVMHRDIKASNILLDGEMRGRVGDFGLAKLYSHDGVPNTTRVVGTLGYLAPEMATLAVPTSSSDVYSFGVVVLEVVCGRRPIEHGAGEEGEDDILLVDWVRELYGSGRVAEAVDKRLEVEEGEELVEEVKMVLKLGLACCHPDPTKRPNMKQVVAVLVEHTDDSAAASSPTHLLTELARDGGSGRRTRSSNDKILDLN